MGNCCSEEDDEDQGSLLANEALSASTSQVVPTAPGDAATKHPDESYGEFYTRKGRGLTYDEATARDENYVMDYMDGTATKVQAETKQENEIAVPIMERTPSAQWVSSNKDGSLSTSQADTVTKVQAETKEENEIETKQENEIEAKQRSEEISNMRKLLQQGQVGKTKKKSSRIGGHKKIYFWVDVDENLSRFYWSSGTKKTSIEKATFLNVVDIHDVAPTPRDETKFRIQYSTAVDGSLELRDFDAMSSSQRTQWVLGLSQLKDSLAANEELIEACKKGGVAKVRKVLEVEGVDVNYRSTHLGTSPLYKASAKGHVNIVRHLLSVKGVQVNQGDDNGHTALIVAAANGHVEVVRLLLRVKEINVNQTSNDGDSALCLASHKGRVKVVRLLSSVEGIDVSQADINGNTALLMASAFPGNNKCHVDIVRILLGVDGLDINQTNNKGFTAVYMASTEGHVDIFRLLLGVNGVDVNQAASDGMTPLLIASRFGHIEFVRALMSVEGMNVNQTANDGGTALHWASAKGHVDIVRLLLSVKETNVNQADNDGYTALIWASQEMDDLSSAERRGLVANKVERSHVKITRLLLGAKGIEVNHTANEGFTAMCMAAQKGHVDIVRLFLGVEGLDVNQTMNDAGKTLLIVAAINGHKNMVHLILGVEGIDMNQAMNDVVLGVEGTALSLASKQGHVQVVRLLTDAKKEKMLYEKDAVRRVTGGLSPATKKRWNENYSERLSGSEVALQ